MDHKRLTLFAGHYGSGKTNIAVNYSLYLRGLGLPVTVADLDIVNPYFRTKDSAKVLGRFFDGIEYRGFDQKVVEDLAKFSGVSVWNGLTDIDHPTQILADMLTMEEHIAKPLNKCKVVFVGDDYGQGGNDESVYKSDFGFVTLHFAQNGK